MENTLDWKRANNGSIYYSCAPCKKNGFIATPRCLYQPSVPSSHARCWAILDRGSQCACKKCGLLIFLFSIFYQVLRQHFRLGDYRVNRFLL